MKKKPSTSARERKLLIAVRKLRMLVMERIDVIEDYCNDHSSDRPTDVTVGLDKMRKVFYTTDPEDIL